MARKDDLMLGLPLLQGHVDATAAALEALHRKHSWVPGSHQIRPSPEVCLDKARVEESIVRLYSSIDDWILNEVFGADVVETSEGKLAVTDRDNIISEPVLRPNQFPYNVPNGTKHYILWHASSSDPWKECKSRTTEVILQLLQKRLSHGNFEFVWYENPKMTVPGLFHVQVFWREIVRSSKWKDDSLRLQEKMDLARAARFKRRSKAVPSQFAESFPRICRLFEMRHWNQSAKSQTSCGREVEDQAIKIYGELHLDSIYPLLEFCGATSDNTTFLDLGSGCGKVAMAASLFCGRSVGVEICKSRHAEAIALHEKFSRILENLSTAGRCKVSHCELRSSDMFEMPWSNFSHVYTCSTCFNPRMMLRIAEKASKELDEGSIICTVTHALDVSSRNLVCVGHQRLKFSWGDDVVFFFRKKVIQSDDITGGEGGYRSASNSSHASQINLEGSMLQKLGHYEKAIAKYRACLRLDGDYAPAHLNMTTCLSQLADKSSANNNASEAIARAFRSKARKHCRCAIEVAHGSDITCAYSNLSVLYMKDSMLKEARRECENALRRSRLLSRSFRHACWNLNSIMRRQNLKDIAIRRMWGLMESQGVTAIRTSPGEPSQLPIDKSSRSATSLHPLTVVCVKWGTKYGADYVFRLHSAIKRYLPSLRKFICLTDAPDELSAETDIVTLKLEFGWFGWWNKATLFSPRVANELEGRILYIDLDTVIVGSLDKLATYCGCFGILNTEDIDNEGKDFSDGYNSSMLLWDASDASTRSRLAQIYSTLRTHFQVVNNFVHRFDHWLEMTLTHVDIIQVLYPGLVVDFKHCCKEEVPKQSSIVIFPLSPKPHDFPASWVAQFWLTPSETESRNAERNNDKQEEANDSVSKCS